MRENLLKKIFLKFKSSYPLLPSAKDELIGVSPALLPQQIKPQTTFWMDVEICQEPFIMANNITFQIALSTFGTGCRRHWTLFSKSA